LVEPLNVALVGAGYISYVHAEAVLATRRARLAAVVDPVAERAQRLARRWQIPLVLPSVESLLERGEVRAAHVLVPPPLHRRIAEPLLRGGIDVLLEKPMAESEAECRLLEDAARIGGAKLLVNQNFVHHPLHSSLRELLQRNAIGAIEHVECIFHMPLRQLAGGQFGHWMFASPKNLLLEQAVHPLSQLDDIAGPFEELTVRPGRPQPVQPGLTLVTSWLVALEGARADAQLSIRLGVSHPVWTLTVIGTDGRIEADLQRNHLRVETPTRWHDAGNDAIVSLRGGAALAGAAMRNAAGYGLATVGLRGRSDPFFHSMRASVSTFYGALAEPDAAGLVNPQGRRVVGLCERIAAATPLEPPRFARQRGDGGPAALDVLVLGGSGFIGGRLAKRLAAEGRSVGVYARGLSGLPADFEQPNIKLIAGSITDGPALDTAMRDAKAVVHLAHGGGNSWPEIEAQMIGGARLSAERALTHGVQQFVFVSSIAALFLGDPERTITAATEPDEQPEARADYARGKIHCERLLRDLHETRGLPLTIVRPGVVLGKGTSPFHSGFGLFNRESHCLGWNAGLNPLPLVLADDVVSAILAILTRPEAVGKAYNLVGDVRLSARDYLAELSRWTGRPLRFHAHRPRLLLAAEAAKWSIKRAGGRRDAQMVTLRDLRSRGLVSPFRTDVEARELAWQPVANRDTFLEQAFAGVGRARGNG
jgi:predicted dehydrogenase/nucleoside-diphosphate-sugar epimerase